MQISGHKTRRYNIVSEGNTPFFSACEQRGGMSWTKSLLNYAIPSALTFVAGYLLKSVGPRARVVHWFPAYFGFQVPFTGADGAHPAQADIVIPVPDSGMGAALGFSEESGIPFQVGLIRNHYVGRTFIEPGQGIRHFGVKVKLNPMRETLEGRRVVVDDSIVRGTTSRKIVKMIRSAGAREVHVRVSSPPIHWPCYYGIDTPTRKELIASSHDVEEIRRYLSADSLGYLSLDGMLKSTGSSPDQFCHACFTGDYRVGFQREVTPQLSLFDG